MNCHKLNTNYRKVNTMHYITDPTPAPEPHPYPLSKGRGGFWGRGIVGVTEPLYPYAPHGRGFEGTRPGVQFHAPVGGCGRVCIVWELWVLLLMIYGLHGMFPP